MAFPSNTRTQSNIAKIEKVQLTGISKADDVTEAADIADTEDVSYKIIKGYCSE